MISKGKSYGFYCRNSRQSKNPYKTMWILLCIIYFSTSWNTKRSQTCPIILARLVSGSGRMKAKSLDLLICGESTCQIQRGGAPEGKWRHSQVGKSISTLCGCSSYRLKWKSICLVFFSVVLGIEGLFTSLSLVDL